ncbi:hypothetical protein Bca52824_017885 [Brassica carinata]|uniref:Reverse transcriptase zinc-binding domain-containing protein n=1 Tax=Brassica carinata TaxID=52824 RepID=A0A8X7VMW5_BRACI|nr:hypothetical protein Bca52824_017885 [Brassica carinata]
MPGPAGSESDHWQWNLLCGNGREWNEGLLEQLFTDDTCGQIKAIHPAGRNCADSYSWEYTKTGHYTVKSVYWVQINVIGVEKESQEVLQPSLDGLYQQVWRLNTSPKIHYFLWRCLSNALPVAENMVHRHITKDKRCSRCDAAEESINHVLFQCPYARLVWAVAQVHIPPSGLWADSFFSNLQWVLNQKKRVPKETN